MPWLIGRAKRQRMEQGVMSGCGAGRGPWHAGGTAGSGSPGDFFCGLIDVSLVWNQASKEQANFFTSKVQIFTLKLSDRTVSAVGWVWKSEGNRGEWRGARVSTDVKRCEWFGGPNPSGWDRPPGSQQSSSRGGVTQASQGRTTQNWGSIPELDL